MAQKTEAVSGTASGSGPFFPCPLLIFLIWRGLFGPYEMPEEARLFWENVLRQMSETEEWKQTCEKYGWTVTFQGAEEFASFLEAEEQEYAVLLEEIGMRQP